MSHDALSIHPSLKPSSQILTPCNTLFYGKTGTHARTVHTQLEITGAGWEDKGEQRKRLLCFILFFPAKMERIIALPVPMPLGNSLTPNP